jgi:valyl-tRNA synthetase
MCPAKGKGEDGPPGLKKTASKVTYDNPTPEGEKPNLDEFPAEYSPPRVECAWASWWAGQGFFRNNGTGSEQFVMILPPPNVTGELHLGHALMASIEDSLTRYHRMMGHDTIWLPGTDHAGIATQVRVEKMIAIEQGKTRKDISREEFLAQAHEWTRQYGGNICGQLRAMGSSLDWERYYFTLDESRSIAVTEAFVRLYDQGEIYRAERLVNWDCALQTAISDAEVEFKELTGRRLLPVPGHKFDKYPFGVLTYFRYPIAGPDGCPTDEAVLIATTRLETMLGDEAVAIHPKDPRYEHLHGKCVYHPFRKCTLRIILDDILVDMAFGTGVVKVTPAHDPNDFECGRRHGLKLTNIFTIDGKINDVVPEFAGMPRFDARAELTKRMKAMRLWERDEEHAMRLGITQRSGDICEQVIKEQWFVDTASMAAAAIRCVQEGEITICPPTFELDWRAWHEKTRPWCISRQLWWGHRIPAYRVTVGGAVQADWVVGRTADEALARAAEKFAADPSTITLEQDEDVLDTWFSSALLPFTGFHWPSDNPELAKYYPGTLLETGWDILTFWVSRMVMMSLALNGRVPFRQVLLHPLVRDPLGRKMSKSLGNVVDPLHVKNGIELETLVRNLNGAHLDPRELATATEGMHKMFPHGIPQCGVDSMRLALCSFAGVGRKAPININIIVSYRNFCNKIWNAVKFAMPNIRATNGIDPSLLSFADKWVLSKLSLALLLAKQGFEDFKMGEAVKGMVHFFHDEFCSVYLETTKPIFQGADGPRNAHVGAVIYECIESSLRMLHPFMPFVTEDLWQRIPKRFDVPSIMVAPYPQVNPEWAAFDGHVVETAILCATAARHIKTTYSLKANAMKVRIATDIPDIEDAFETIRALAQVGEITRLPRGSPPEVGYSATVVNEAIEVRLDLAGLIDFQKEIASAQGKKAKLLDNFRKLDEKMKAPTYSTKVPANVQEKERERLGQLGAQIAALDEVIAGLTQAT